jgi:predicted nucleic acid-binding protein
VIVLDAWVLIAHLDDNDAHHERAHRLLTEVAGQPKQMNVLTMAEVLVAPARAGRRRAAQEILDRFQIEVVALPAEVAGNLAELRATSGLKMPDCCTLLTAERSSAGLATFDDRLRRVSRDRGIRVLPAEPESEIEHADG